MKLAVIFAFFLSFSAAEKSQRIIGGNVVIPGQFPFLAAIYKTTADGAYFCGGSIITQRWILTAGQCVEGATSFTIYLGTSNIKTPDSSVLRVATEEYILHPDFNPETLENDIGLIKLRMEITFSDYIQSAYLAYFDIEPETNYGEISAVGWGQTSDNAGLSDQLHHVTQTVLQNDECRLTYGEQITDKMICVGGNYNEGICHGDTGSPLVLSYRLSKTVHGVASFLSGNGCESTDPSGFTRVHPYLDWISNITGY